MKTQTFNGKTYKMDKDGDPYYYRYSWQNRMHREVWEFYNGKIPEGYEIHHIDEDKHNNTIENLEMIERSKHRKMHGSKTPWPQESRDAAKFWHQNVYPKEERSEAAKRGWVNFRKKKENEDIKDK